MTTSSRASKPEVSGTWDSKVFSLSQSLIDTDWFSRNPLCGNISVIQFPIVLLLSHVWLFVTPWIVALQAPQSMEFSRQEYWSQLPFPTPGDLPKPRNWTLIFCIVRQVLYHCTTGKPLPIILDNDKFNAMWLPRYVHKEKRDHIWAWNMSRSISHALQYVYILFMI